MHWTYYPRLTVTTTYEAHEDSFPNFAKWLTSFQERPGKGLSYPSVGPYQLAGPGRLDAHVREVSAAVFDVDHEVTLERLAECRRRLAGVEHVWYPSPSFTAEAPRYRLVVSLTVGVPATAWKRERARLIESFAIPADPQTSNSISHSYYVPTRKQVHYSPGAPVYVDYWGRGTSVANTVDLPDDWSPPDDEGPVDLAPIVEKLEQIATSLKRKKDSRAAWVERLLAGEPLAADGDRQQVTTRLTMMLANRLPDVGVNTLMHLFAPSHRAMAAEGSKLTASEIRRRLVSAVTKVARDRLNLEVMSKQLRSL